MKKIPAFEEFLKSNISVTNENGVSNNEEDLIPESAKRKLWEYMHECMESAIAYEDDSMDVHTIEEYLKESAKMMSSMATKVLKENKCLSKFAEKAINENDKHDDKEAKEKVKEYVKSRLDEACNKMKESFSKGIEKSMLENSSIASMVANEMMKS